MAYNNGFPVGYQPYYQQYTQPQVQIPQYQPQPPTQQAQQAQMQNNLIWVQGEAGAKSYLVAPNTTVQLWDSEDQVIYLKSADASGMPSMKVLDYKIRGQAMPAVNQMNNVANPSQEYVTREELAQFEAKIKEQFESITQAQPVRTRAKKEKEAAEDNG